MARNICLVNAFGAATAIAKVSADDFARINKHRWYLSAGGYAVRHQNGKTVYMHRAIVRVRGKRLVVDHINRDKIDNRRSNLRAVSQSENILNGGTWRNNTSGVKGVYWHSIGKCWCATIQFRCISYYLGLFKSLRSAKAARSAAERKFKILQRKAG